MAERARSHGIACVFISHDLSVVRAVCPRVMVMAGGQIIEDGPTVNVFKQPREAITRTLVEAALDWRQELDKEPHRQDNRDTMMQPGKTNLITDIDGLKVGNAAEGRSNQALPSSQPTNPLQRVFLSLAVRRAAGRHHCLTPISLSVISMQSFFPAARPLALMPQAVSWKACAVPDAVCRWPPSCPIVPARSFST